MFTHRPTHEERRLADLAHRIDNVVRAIAALEPIEDLNDENLRDGENIRLMRRGALRALENLRETLIRMQEERQQLVADSERSRLEL